MKIPEKIKQIDEWTLCEEIVLLFRKYKVAEDDQYKIIDLFTALYQAEVEKEREACAKIAENAKWRWEGKCREAIMKAADATAQTIRERGEG